MFLFVRASVKLFGQSLRQTLQQILPASCRAHLHTAPFVDETFYPLAIGNQSYHPQGQNPMDLLSTDFPSMSRLHR